VKDKWFVQPEVSVVVVAGSCQSLNAHMEATLNLGNSTLQNRLF